MFREDAMRETEHSIEYARRMLEEAKKDVISQENDIKRWIEELNRLKSETCEILPEDHWYFACE